MSEEFWFTFGRTIRRSLVVFNIFQSISLVGKVLSSTISALLSSTFNCCLMIQGNLIEIQKILGKNNSQLTIRFIFE